MREKKLENYILQETFKDKRIGLELSGGGHKSSCLSYRSTFCICPKNRLLENVKHLSTVSGGFVVMGLIYKLNDYRFPTSQEYKEKIQDQIIEYFTGKSLQRKFLYITALTSALKYTWNIDRYIQEIPNMPIICIIRQPPPYT